MTSKSLIDQIQALQIQHASLNFFAIADAAQDETLLDHFTQSGAKTQSKCLLADLGPDADKVSPHLLQMPSPQQAAELWGNAMQYAAQLPPALTILASKDSFATLYKHLGYFTRVSLPDKSEMLLAYWDPAILGTLLGNDKDETLYVAGPVLAPQQMQALLAPIVAWWYWDRSGQLQRIDGAGAGVNVDVAEPMLLDQKQVDTLTEASVPDHVLAYLKDTQPALLERIPPKEQYPTVRRLLVQANALHLDAMQDQVRFVGVSLIYGEQMKVDESIQKLLEKVQQRALKLGDALQQFPALTKGKP
jgi:hypothetical protein